MELHGEIRNGVVVLESGCALPEGTPVVVNVRQKSAGPGRKRIQLPLVPSTQPGSVSLTSDRVAELLEQEDVSS